MTKSLLEKPSTTASFYHNPTRRIVENGCFARLPSLLATFKPRDILLVLGERSFRRSPYFSQLQETLSPYHLVFATAVAQNPTQSCLREEINRLRNDSFDLILGIGGGSVLDVCKIFSVFLKNPLLDLNDFIAGGPISTHGSIPMIAVPTTAGSGSEVTPFASLETDGHRKITLSHPAFHPSIALVDPELTYSMPEYLTACTGFDALSQAIESFWSVCATPFSKTHSLRALELVASNLKVVIADSQAGRLAMAYGSCEAGLAIAQAKTTAVHSVSYPLTAHFKIAHGHACALTLSSFVRYNELVLKESGRPLLNAFGASAYSAMADQIDNLMDAVGLERRLSALGVTESGIELILRDGFRPDRVRNNPREVTVEALRKILFKIY